MMLADFIYAQLFGNHGHKEKLASFIVAYANLVKDLLTSTRKTAHHLYEVMNRMKNPVRINAPYNIFAFASVHIQTLSDSLSAILRKLKILNIF